MSEWTVGQKVVVVRAGWGYRTDIEGEAVVKRVGKNSVWTSGDRRWRLDGSEWGATKGSLIVPAGSPRCRRYEVDAAGEWRLADLRAAAKTAREKARLADFEAEKAEERLAKVEARLDALKAKHAAEEMAE